MMTIPSAGVRVSFAGLRPDMTEGKVMGTATGESFEYEGHTFCWIREDDTGYRSCARLDVISEETS